MLNHNLQILLTNVVSVDSVSLGKDVRLSKLIPTKYL